MNTWILKWYPEKYEWNDYNEALMKTKNNEMHIQMWVCSSNSLEIGDRVYVLKFGNEPNGIVASGYVNCESYYMMHGYKKSRGHVQICFDKIVDFETENTFNLMDFYDVFKRFYLFNISTEINITNFVKIVQVIEKKLSKVIGVSVVFKKYPLSTALWLTIAITSYENYKNNVSLKDMYFNIHAIKIKAQSLCEQNFHDDMLIEWYNQINNDYIYNNLINNVETADRTISLNELWGQKYNIESLIKFDVFKTKVGIITAKELFHFINNEYADLLDTNISNNKFCLEDHSKKDNLLSEDFLVKVNSNNSFEEEEEVLFKKEEHISQRTRKFSISELKEKTENNKINKVKSATIKTYIRDSLVKEYTKLLANGYCQLCGNKAPFKDSYGNPYLEIHHIIWLSNGGKDTIENTVALCPNCHRKMHIINAKEDIEKLLRKKVLS